MNLGALAGQAGAEGGRTLGDLSPVSGRRLSPEDLWLMMQTAQPEVLNLPQSVPQRGMSTTGGGVMAGPPTDDPMVRHPYAQMRADRRPAVTDEAGQPVMPGDADMALRMLLYRRQLGRDRIEHNWGPLGAY